MDVCTLSLVTTMTLVFCTGKFECVIKEDGIRYCTRSPSYDCNKPPAPVWECKRPDGSEYTKPYREVG